MTDLRVELKVCEGCGALWLRAGLEGTRDGVYCEGCRKRLADFPAPKGRRAIYRAERRATRPLEASAASRTLERGVLHRAGVAAGNSGGAR